MLSLILAALASVFTVVPTSPATSGAWTTYLHPYRYTDLHARGDTLWCATQEAGLLRFDLASHTFGSITRFPNGLASNDLSVLAYDRSGRLWVGTNGAGASRMSADGSSWKLVNAFDGLPSDTVNCFRAEGDTVWIGTPQGLAFWNGSTIAGSLPVFGQPSPFASDDVTGVVPRGDTLWVSTRSGVYYLPRSDPRAVWTLQNTNLSTPDVRALVTNDTLIFCRTNANVVYKLTDSGWFPLFGPGSVYRLYEDDGIITAASNLGLWRLMNSGWLQLTGDVVATPSDETVNPACAPIGGGYYAAANLNGLIVQPALGATSGWPLYTPDVPCGNDIRDLGVDGTHVWMNTEQEGIARFDGHHWKVWPPSTFCPTCDTSFYQTLFAKALLVDRIGHKWFGCWGSSLEEADDSTEPGTWIHHIVNDNLGASLHTYMWASAADSSGGRWFGADTPSLGVIIPIGVDYWADSAWVSGSPPDTVTRHTAVYRGSFRPDNSELAGTKVHGLTVDKFGRVWVGLSGQGIQSFTVPPINTIPSMTRIPGSNSLDVQGLYAYGDTVWALTTHELQRYKRTPPDFPLATYNIPETTPLFAVHPLDVASDGSPWVGTEAGIRVFHRDGGSEDINTSNSPIAGNQVYSIRIDRRTGIVWISTSTGMNRYDPGYRPPPPPQVAQLDVRVYPNPISLSRMGIQLRLKGNAGVYRGTIYDLLGRQIGTFDVPADGRVIWDGKDAAGRMVKPGIYLVRVDAGGRSATARVAVLR